MARTPKMTLRNMLARVNRLTAEAAVLMQKSTPQLSQKERARIDERVSRIFESIAALDRPIITTCGSHADGVEKLKIARDLMADDHREELFFAYIESALADLTTYTTQMAAKTTTPTAQT